MVGIKRLYEYYAEKVTAVFEKNRRMSVSSGLGFHFSVLQKDCEINVILIFNVWARRLTARVNVTATFHWACQHYFLKLPFLMRWSCNGHGRVTSFRRKEIVSAFTYPMFRLDFHQTCVIVFHRADSVGIRYGGPGTQRVRADNGKWIISEYIVAWLGGSEHCASEWSCATIINSPRL